MKFYGVRGGQAEESASPEDFKAARQIGVIRLGQRGLYFRISLKHYYMPYAQITGLFRRVLLIPARMCCGKGTFEVENLVVVDEAGEAAQIQLPGKKAAQELMKELKERVPHADFAVPSKEKEEN